MPNWCSNDLFISGNAGLIKDAVAKYFDGDGAPDYNKIAPYPEEFRELDRKRDILIANLNMMTNGEREAWIKAYGWPKDGYNQGGYEWCVKNWGSKWLPTNINGPKFNKKGGYKVSFDSPWTPPIAVFVALSELCPRLKFTIKSYERGMQFKSVVIIKAGVILSSCTSEYCGSRGG